MNRVVQKMRRRVGALRLKNLFAPPPELSQHTLETGSKRCELCSSLCTKLNIAQLRRNSSML